MDPEARAMFQREIEQAAAAWKRQEMRNRRRDRVLWLQAAITTASLIVSAAAVAHSALGVYSTWNNSMVWRMVLVGIIALGLVVLSITYGFRRGLAVGHAEAAASPPTDLQPVPPRLDPPPRPKPYKELPIAAPRR